MYLGRCLRLRPTAGLLRPVTAMGELKTMKFILLQSWSPVS